VSVTIAAVTFPFIVFSKYHLFVFDLEKLLFNMIINYLVFPAQAALEINSFQFQQFTVTITYYSGWPRMLSKKSVFPEALPGLLLTEYDFPMSIYNLDFAFQNEINRTVIHLTFLQYNLLRFKRNFLTKIDTLNQCWLLILTKKSLQQALTFMNCYFRSYLVW